VFRFMTGHVPDVDKVKALIEGGLPSRFEGWYRRRRQTLQFVERGETGEMKRHPGAEFGPDPAAHGADLLHVVVPARYDQIDNLGMNFPVPELLEGGQNGLEAPFGKVAVVFVRETLQVDAGGIQDVT